MATRNSKLPNNQEIAIELAKAALLGGALQRLNPVEGTTARARHDALYAVTLYRTILNRLENPPVKKEPA